jgi:hypothetical protein
MVSCTSKSPLLRWWTSRKYKYAHGSLSSYNFPNAFQLRCALSAMEHLKFTMDTPCSTMIPFKFTQKIFYCIIPKLHVKTCNRPHHIIFSTIHMALRLHYNFKLLIWLHIIYEFSIFLSTCSILQVPHRCRENPQSF